jgi:peptidoglycan hydrolase-like protein with peptidoglycan-binding domain
MNGSWVWRLQQRLADRGWAVTVDGDYGPETTTVVVAFQREKGLTVDGEVFTATWGALWAAPVT